MFNTNFLLASLVWGSVGTGYFLYGKKQGAAVPLAGGLALIAVSWLVPSVVWMSVICIGLIGAMYGLSKNGY